MRVTSKHPAPLDERCEDCGKFLLRTFDRDEADLCLGHVEVVSVSAEA